MTNTPQKEKLVEVQLKRGYVPRGAEPREGGIYDKVEAGTIVSLPKSEAVDLITQGIAAPTNMTFD